MADGTKIEWADATWSPLVGCDKVSPGCDHCYAIRTAHRMSANPNPKIAEAYAGTEADGDWTGQVNLLPQRLDQPFRWARPRRIFVNAQSDLFHADVPDEFIARVFAVMALTPQHTYQILTKRHGRMRSLLSSPTFRIAVLDQAYLMAVDEVAAVKVPAKIAREYRDWVTVAVGLRDLPVDGPSALPWPLPNVWMGTSVEDQARADLRIPALLDTPAAVRFLSCEPLLGPVTLDPRWLNGPEDDEYCACGDGDTSGCSMIDWVIVGGESGPGARPMHPGWARSLRDQCSATGVAYHFKQHGEYVETSNGTTIVHADGEVTTRRIPLPDGAARMRRVGKHAAGRVLDGRTWDEYPDAVVPG